MPSARQVAVRVIERVHKDNAFSALALDAELERYPELSARDRNFATQLVYTSLRAQAVLESRVLSLAKQPPRDAYTQAELLVASCQILLLDRVPAFAAVDEAVNNVRGRRGAKVSGFVNAILRRLVAEAEPLELEAAVRDSVPAWLFRRLVSAVGLQESLALIGASRTPPPLCLRVDPRHGVPPGVKQAERGRVSPFCYRLSRTGSLRKRSDLGETTVVQEEGAQAVALLLGARPGERVLDACAGRGQKTALILARQPSIKLVASDVNPNKLVALRAECERLRLPPVETFPVDLSLGTGDIEGGFDRVLVDAPCSGVGTLRRRPEIARRLTETDVQRLAGLSLKILKHTARLLRPGGRLVFAVCSVLPEECEKVAAQASELLVPADFDASEFVPSLDLGRADLRLLPLRDGTDGYFVASFVRRSDG